MMITVTYGIHEHSHIWQTEIKTQINREKKTIPKLSLSVEYSNDFDVDLWLAIGA